MSTTQTMHAIDGAIGPVPERWLAPDVELHGPAPHASCIGRHAVACRLADLASYLEGADVRLTVDVGRGVAEWLSGPTEGAQSGMRIVCVFDVDEGLVRCVRVYTDDLRPPAPS